MAHGIVSSLRSNASIQFCISSVQCLSWTIYFDFLRFSWQIHTRIFSTVFIPSNMYLREISFGKSYSHVTSTLWSQLFVLVLVSCAFIEYNVECYTFTYVENIESSLLLYRWFLDEKSIEHFSLPDTCSSSGYSSGHSSDLSSKQIVSHRAITCEHVTSMNKPYDQPICSTTDPCYLSSTSGQYLGTRLNAYRYPLANELILIREQHEHLLEQTVRHDDDHQYYEIG
jgi:hypothetical protein